MTNHFRLRERGSTVRTEALAGCTTFVTLAYIILINPMVLGETGMDAGAVLVATCLASAFGCLVMGLWANYPIALAPGLGLNTYFAAIAVGTMGLSWEVALGAVFLSGALMLTLSVLPVREWVLDGIPRSQKMAIAAGIGFFLAIIGLRNVGVVVDSEATLVTLGDLGQWTVLLATLGFIAMVALEYRGLPGAVLLCILAVATVGWAFGLAAAPESLVSAPPSLAPTALQLDVAAALEVGLVAIVFSFLMVDLFDTSGTLVAVLNEAGLTDADGREPMLRRALIADSSATMVGALLGTSTTTSYVESAAGVRAGGRTGLTAVVGGGPLPRGAAARAGGDGHPGLRDRPGHLLRGVRHGARAAPPTLGRPHGVRPGHRDRAGDALHLLDRHRHRHGVHRLRAHQAGLRARLGSERRRGGRGRALPDSVRRHAGLATRRG